ncbi:uncharacterized protein LOC142639582 [Castanea sativa]|uniref:uncharacterized protein LOC142639582 n=1 Tax=Castanea sativa TaxID=21020 RepID=UPI003F650C66
MASSSATDASNSNSTQSALSFGITMADESTNNPYFLPATKSLGIVLTSQPLTGPKNYMSWIYLHHWFNTWNRCNTIILSWLTNSLSRDLKPSVMYINTGKDLWIDLKDRLSQGNTPRLFQLQKEISHLSQGSLTHKEHVFCFLMGLNDSYGNIIGQILLIEPFPPVSKVCSLILQEEKRRSISHGVNMVYLVIATAMYANNNRGHQGHN